MSKVGVNKGGPVAKRKPPTSTTANTAKEKRKMNWIRMNSKGNKVQKKAPAQGKPQKMAPPVDAQQFSANWKSLQEVLKASQPVKKPQPETPKHQNAVPKKEAKESVSRTFTKSNVHPKQTDSGKKGKHKPNTDRVASISEVNSKVQNASVSKQSSAPKRKNSDPTSNSDLHAVKKKKKKTAAPVVVEKKPTEDDLWFDDVDPDDIEATVGAEAAEIMRKKQGVHKSQDIESALVKERGFEGLTRAVAIDCEMVGVGPDGEESILARVSLVNHFGKCIYDKYVKPTERVTDYRTAVSGIRPQDIRNGEDVRTVQREVAEILQGRIVVGHAIYNDLKILLLDHPKKKIRDTQKYKPFRKAVKSGRPSLKLLCKEILNVKVQQGEHSSVQDAQATMRLYTMARKEWEAAIKNSHKNGDVKKKSERKPRLPKKNRAKI